jgi:Flp pilus assembly protein TadG
MAIIWISAVVLMVVAFGSFAVDYGRVSLAKTELQTAATAAARAAAANLSGGVTAAQTAAVTIASKNTVDGVPVSLDATTDMEFGTWDDTTRTFTVLTGTARAGATAIRVTLGRTAARGNAIQLQLGRVVGMTQCDVNASAIARTSPPTYPFVGLDWVNVGGMGNTDSYNSTTGNYGGTNKHAFGHIASNGTITVGGSGIVNGDAHPGIGRSVVSGGQEGVNGSTSQLNC